ncbi:MAG: nickel-responsive transcriptional regulator NikR [Gemmataceae bacterium]|nr:nickel-responsive transcriptional regulator NikR [Gemmataceae bacterium]MDW8244460.1 nickel-responsive transcriptional regulator NikR [Thermogemmata sp.]
MSELARFSVSLEADLLQAFDRYVRAGAFATRSEAIRQLLHESLTRQSFLTDQTPVLASLTLVYEHHRPHLVEKLLALQHEHADQVIASLHVHIDHDRCLEVLVLRGRGQQLQQLAESLRGLKGVHRGELTLAETTIPTTALRLEGAPVASGASSPATATGQPPAASAHTHPPTTETSTSTGRSAARSGPPRPHRSSRSPSRRT